MKENALLKRLKALKLQDTTLNLWIVRKIETRHPVRYSTLRVRITDQFGALLLKSVKTRILWAEVCEPYEYETAELGDDVCLAQPLSETQNVKDVIEDIAAGVDAAVVSSEDELIDAYAYVVELYWPNGDILLAFRRVPESWAAKRVKGFWNAAFKENHLIDLEANAVFRMDGCYDFMVLDDQVLVLDKKNFDRSFNFRRGMELKRDKLFDEFETLSLFENLQPIKEKCHDNLRYLRRLASIEKFKYYQDPDFIKKLRLATKREGWPIEFRNGRMIVTPDNLDDVLTVLCNNRLQSLINTEKFDVTSKKKIGE